MTVLARKKTALIVCFIILFLAGLCLGFLIGMNAGEEDSAYNEMSPTKDLYECYSTIYITTNDSDQTAISTADLAVSLRLSSSFLQSENILTPINAKYPYSDYTLTIEQIESTELCKIVARSENKEHLAEICNMATSFLCEELENTMVDYIRVRVVDLARQPKLPVGTQNPS
jgi:capsular polysaccharide biosynthesis protein